MKVYILLKKEYHGGGSLLTTYDFDLLLEPPTEIGQWQKLLSLEPDECVDVYKSFPNEAYTEAEVTIYRVSNIGGQFQIKILERFLTERLK